MQEHHTEQHSQHPHIAITIGKGQSAVRDHVDHFADAVMAVVTVADPHHLDAIENTPGVGDRHDPDVRPPLPFR